mgnify:CR=1 FL=1
MSGVADAREARHPAAGDLDDLGEHDGGTHPSSALAVQRLVDDDRLEGLRVACNAGHEVLHALVMTVASGPRLGRQRRQGFGGNVLGGRHRSATEPEGLRTRWTRQTAIREGKPATPTGGPRETQRGSAATEVSFGLRCAVRGK